MTVTTLPAFALLCLLNAVVPGPNFLLVLRAQASGGRVAARAAVGGIGAAQLLWGLLAIGGVAATFEQAPLLFVAMKLLGALYIGAIGLRLVLRGIDEPSLEADATGTRRGARFALEGLLTCLLNPNILLFYLAIFPQFLSAATSRPAGAMALVLLYVAINVLWFTGVARVFERLGTRGMRPAVKRWAARGVGAGLVGFGAMFVARL